ncbi:MAG: hypothetical protein INR65_03010 [Gluconacetobacter diazotrophicus]|nr:hypothetical protein [Gluconacetobacter diazotrophicus]
MPASLNGDRRARDAVARSTGKTPRRAAGRRLALAAACAALAAGPVRPANAHGAEPSAVTHVLFVGDSFTHGRYDPVRRFAGGFDAGPGAADGSHVHDLLCLAAATCSAAEAVLPNDPDRVAYPAGDDTLPAKLGFLLANPADQYAEAGPYGGVPGIVLRLAAEARVPLDVSILTVSASSLGGKNLGGSRKNAPLIESDRWDRVVLQEKSSLPLPAQVVVAGRTVPTKGDPAAFASGVAAIVSGIDAADRAAGRAPIPVTLFQTPPMASYGYVSDDPALPLYGTSYGSPGTAAAPYVGAADPMAQMESDLRASYRAVAAGWNAQNPTGSRITVSPVGDAWITAMRLGVAVRDPYVASRRFGTVDLWDSDILDACCTVPIGYHPSSAGAYLDALVLFGTISGRDTVFFGPNDPVARALGIPAAAAVGLQAAASLTLRERPAG